MPPLLKTFVSVCGENVVIITVIMIIVIVVVMITHWRCESEAKASWVLCLVPAKLKDAVSHQAPVLPGHVLIAVQAENAALYP